MGDTESRCEMQALGFTNPHSGALGKLLGDNVDYRSKSVICFVIFNHLTDRTVCVKDISATFHLSKPTTIRLCRRLEEQGWVERLADNGDRRRIIIRPSAELRNKLNDSWRYRPQRGPV